MTVCMRVNTAISAATRATKIARLGRFKSDTFSQRGLITSGPLYAQASSTSPSSSLSTSSKNGKNSVPSPAKEPSLSTSNKQNQNGDRDRDRDRDRAEPWSGGGPPVRSLYKAPPRASSMSSPEMRAMLLSLLAFVEIVFCLNLAHMIWAAKRQARVVVLVPLIAEVELTPTKEEQNKSVDEKEEEKIIATPSENVPVSEQLNDLIYPLIIITTSVVCALLLLWIPSRTATRVDFHIPSQSVRVHHPGIKRLFPTPVEFKLGDLYTKELLSQHAATSTNASLSGGVGGLGPLSTGNKPVLLYAKGQRFPRTLDPTGEFNVKKFNEIFYGADNTK